MVNTLIRTYMDVQQARERLEAADRRVQAAYKQYQRTLKEFGPAPTHGWWRVKLQAHEDAVADALAQYGAAVSEIGAALASASMRPPF
jgi:outer membrane protein TolC